MRRLAASNGLWSAVLNWSRIGLNSIVFFVLARWLTLDEIGQFAIAYSPIVLLQGVQRSGFGDLVIQHDSDADDYVDTAFWISLGVGALLSAATFAGSLLTRSLGGHSEVASFLGILSLVPFLVGLSAVPEALLRKRYEMRALAIRTCVSLSLAGAVALWLGYHGHGAFALTIFVLVSAAVSMVLVLLQSRWRPAGGPRRRHLPSAMRRLGAVSGRMLASGATVPALQLFVGIGLGTAAAGAFQIATRVLSLANTVAITPAQFATLPLLVGVRDDPARLGRIICESIGVLSLVSAPIYFGLMAIAPDLLPLVLGAQNASESIDVVRAFLLAGGNMAFIVTFLHAMTAIRRLDTSLWLSLALLAANLAAGGAMLWHSVAYVGLAYSLTGYVAMPFMARLLQTHLGVRPAAVLGAALGPLVAAITMAVLVAIIEEHFLSSQGRLVSLVVQVSAGLTVYVGIAFLVARPQIRSLKTLVTPLLRRRRPAG